MIDKLANSISVCAIIGSLAVAENFKGENMKTFTIRWQRLVDDKGQTCERCGLTESEVHKAFKNLEKSLAPLEIKVTLEEKNLDPAMFARDVSESNRIWINDRPLEEWLDAQVGKSSCEFCCAELGENAECRTIVIEGNAYEMIPAELIIKAGLLAASQLLIVEPASPCCGDKISTESSSRSCCPESDSDLKENNK